MDVCRSCVKVAEREETLAGWIVCVSSRLTDGPSGRRPRPCSPRGWPRWASRRARAGPRPWCWRRLGACVCVRDEAMRSDQSPNARGWWPGPSVQSSAHTHTTQAPQQRQPLTPREVEPREPVRVGQERHARKVVGPLRPRQGARHDAHVRGLALRDPRVDRALGEAGAGRLQGPRQQQEEQEEG